MRSVVAAGFSSAKRSSLVGLAAALTWACAASADDTTIARVLAGLSVDRADVRACLTEQMNADAQRRAEVQRLTDVFGWMEQAVTMPRQSGIAQVVAMGNERAQAFAEIIATFNHERRLDGERLAFVTNGRLGPPHVTAYARVTRALASGHDAKRVMCGE